MQNNNFSEPLIIPNSSLPRRLESSNIETFWIPAFAGMTFLGESLNEKVKNMIM
jgi:hypothetical protein